MAVFNTDQARHFYVTDSTDIIKDGGEFVKIDAGEDFAVASSDIIEKKQVEYINITSAVNKLVPLRDFPSVRQQFRRGSSCQACRCLYNDRYDSGELHGCT